MATKASGAAISDANYAALAEMDWTFKSAYTRGGPHGIHPYPAKFIPQIPHHLIRHLHPGNDTAVMDPFCGSGTTLVEAALAGHKAVGVDLHPLACLISKVKTTQISAGLTDQAHRIIDALHSGGKAVVPDIPRLDHWFKAPVQEVLAQLVMQMDFVEEPHRSALQVALSSIIVQVSNQESDTRYAAVEKSVEGNDVLKKFLRAVVALESALASTWPPLLSPPPVRVIHSDILDVTPSQVGTPVSLVITSPPYPAAYEYWLYHKYRMYWLGMDPLAVREREIGARPHYFRKNPATAADFEQQMTQVFSLLSKVLTAGGHACVQIGDSKIRGEIIDNTALLRRAAEAVGFSNPLTLNRRIPRFRKAFNPANSRIRNESILIFRLEKK